MEPNIFTQDHEEQLSWTEKEFVTANLNDRRLEKRLISLVDAFSQHPEAPIPQAMGNWQASKAAYRFFSNSKVTYEKILAPHKDATIKRLEDYDVILAIQDSSFIDYTSHPQTKNLGFLNDKDHHGLIIHPTLLSTQTGLPLGIIDLEIIKRDIIGIKHTRTERTIAEKESHKWLASYDAIDAIARKHPSKRFINIADREGDIYDFFQEAASRKQTFGNSPDILVRAAWNRCIIEEEQRYIWQHLQSQPCAGTVEIEVGKTKKRTARKTTVEIRYAPIVIQPPQDRYAEKLAPLHLWAVYVHEQCPPQGEEPVSWMLLTTVPIENASDAFTVVQWYTCRWTIERYFKVLKSGCKIEERRLEAAERLLNCIVVDMIVAWRIFFMTMIGRETPDLPATVLFEKPECDALYSFVAKKYVTCDPMPSLNDMIRTIAKLGGFLGRRHDGLPGITAIWRGMWRLADIFATWQLCMSKINPLTQTYG